MVKFRIKLRASTVTGRPGTVFYQIAHRKEVKQITTGLRLLPEEWDARSGRIPPEAAARSPRLAAVQRLIDCDTLLLTRIISQAAQQSGDCRAQTIARRFAASRSTVSVPTYTIGLIARLKAVGRQGTAKNLSATLSSLSEYLGGQDITFAELDRSMLADYEQWLKAKGLKRNSSSFYMRNLRSVYHKAAAPGYTCTPDPFKNVYTGIDHTAKRAVNEQVVARLKALKLEAAPELQLARDLFIFSYCTRGMAFVDMALLKRSNIEGNSIHYTRKKTGHSLSVRIEPAVSRIIERYRSLARADYVLPIIRSDNPNDTYRQYQNRLRHYNRQLKKLAALLGGNIKLTSYVSRHSWASTAHKHNVPLAVISHGMGHQSEKTTQIYLASIDEDVLNRANAELVASLNSRKNMGKR